jgi:hypothetical protein
MVVLRVLSLALLAASFLTATMRSTRKAVPAPMAATSSTIPVLSASEESRRPATNKQIPFIFLCAFFSRSPFPKGILASGSDKATVLAARRPSKAASRMGGCGGE